jgi:hypothetical protein
MPCDLNVVSGWGSPSHLKKSNCARRCRSWQNVFELWRSAKRRLERSNGSRCSSCNCLVHLLASCHVPPGRSSQILRSRYHRELIMGTAWTSQSETVELQNAFEMSEDHFHVLSLTARAVVFRRLRNTPRFVTRSFMDAAGDLAEWVCSDSSDLSSNSSRSRAGLPDR